MRSKKLWIGLIIVGLIATLGAGPAFSADKVLKVGVLGPFTGPAAKNGAEFKASVEMALDKIDYTVGDYKLEIVWIDSQSDPAKAVNIATFHAYSGFSPSYEFGKRFMRTPARRLHGRIAVSAAAMHFIRRYFPGDYKVIPNGVDLAQFDDVPDDDSVGRLLTVHDGAAPSAVLAMGAASNGVML